MRRTGLLALAIVLCAATACTPDRLADPSVPTQPGATSNPPATGTAAPSDPALPPATTTAPLSSSSGASSSTSTAPSAPPADEGARLFRITLSPSILPENMSDARTAAEVVKGSIIMRDAVLHNGLDNSADAGLSETLVGQALQLVQTSVENIRKQGITVTGPTGAVITVVSSSDGVSEVQVCHDLTRVRFHDAQGQPLKLPAGQNGKYFVAPYEDGPRISVLEYDEDVFPPCD